jgi:hypothetical protein
MKSVVIVGIVTLLLLASCSKTTTITYLATDPVTLIPRATINNFVLSRAGYFDWKMAGDTMTWSALVQADSILSIGYQPKGFTNLSANIHTIDVNSAEWKDAKSRVLAIIIETEGAATVVFKEGALPVMDIKVTHLSTLKALRASPLVRYAEPIGYGAYMNTASVSGITYIRSAAAINSATNAYVLGADDPAVKMISIRTVFCSGQVKDALNYVHNKQQLVIS